MRSKTIIIVIIAIAVTIVTIGGFIWYKNSKEVRIKNNAVNQQSQQTIVIDKPISIDVKDIKYDLMSTIDLSRGTEEYKKYPLEKMAIYNIITEDIDKKESDDKKDTDNKAINSKGDSNKKEVVNEVKYETKEDSDSIRDFFKQTKTTRDDYKELVIAFKPKDGYIVGIVKPIDGKEAILEQAIRNYIVAQIEQVTDEEIKSRYTSYQLCKHNGHIIVVVRDKSLEIKENVLSRLKEADTMVEQANGNKENTEKEEEN